MKTKTIKMLDGDWAVVIDALECAMTAGVENENDWCIFKSDEYFGVLEHLKQMIPTEVWEIRNEPVD